jgi:hypothetical protein
VFAKRATILMLMASAALVGCGDVREAAGVKKKAPDEFAVVRRAPLTVPPDFELRPPRPGERPLPAIDPRQQAEAAVLGSSASAAAVPSSSTVDSEDALLRALHIDDVDPSIRAQVDQESALLAVDERNFVERLMFWREPPPPGTAVNAEDERRRLQENEALGRSPTSGTTPSIERKETVRNRIF